MAHISSIGAGIFSDLSACRDAGAAGTPPTSEALWKAAFATEVANGSAGTTGEFTRIQNVREFPSMGTPPNIINVPVYGQTTSSQIQGQSDAPSIELTLNFVGDDWQDASNYLGAYVGDGAQHAFRFTLLNNEPDNYSSTDVTGMGASADNSQYFWIGKIEALLVNPQLTDANTATLTISVQSEFFGAYSSDA